MFIIKIALIKFTICSLIFIILNYIILYWKLFFMKSYNKD